MRVHLLAGAALLLMVAGCNQMPGTPKPGIEVPRPDSVTDFATLYGENCAGCHGKDGQNGASLDLANPLYQAWVDDATLHKVIAERRTWHADARLRTRSRRISDGCTGGRPGARHAHRLAEIRSPEWSDAPAIPGCSSGRCRARTDCLSGRLRPLPRTGPGQNHRSHISGALVNDQSLRTIIIAGRPDLSHPDWRSDIAGRPLTDDEVTES